MKNYYVMEASSNVAEYIRIKDFPEKIKLACSLSEFQYIDRSILYLELDENSGNICQDIIYSEGVLLISERVKDFFDSLPYPLTDDQRKVIYEMDEEIDRSYTERERILNQLDRGMPPPATSSFTMARLLQGDVGSGKTLVSLFICLRIISWKGQCAFMAPTEILAQQHYNNMVNWLTPLGVKVELFLGSISKKQRKISETKSSLISARNIW